MQKRFRVTIQKKFLYNKHGVKLAVQWSKFGNFTRIYDVHAVSCTTRKRELNPI